MFWDMEDEQYYLTFYYNVVVNWFKWVFIWEIEGLFMCYYGWVDLLCSIDKDALGDDWVVSH